MKINDIRQFNQKNLQIYADKLREEIKKEMNINVPDIPMAIDPLIDVMFLERFLILNGKGDLEKSMWDKYKDTLYLKEENKMKR